MKRVVNFKTIGLALLASLFALNMSAQGPGRGFQMTEEDIKERVDNTAKTLKLNDEQHKKALAVEMDFANKMQIEFQKMRNEGGPPTDREAMRAKMMKMRDERNAEYEAILSPEQYKQFIDLQEQRMREMREQRQQSHPEREGSDTARSERGRGRG
jgi:Spy/CpxP family protein refolding chaperone